MQRLIETSPWGEDAATIEQQILSQNKFHSSIQRSQEVERARDELVRTVELTVTRAQSSPWTGHIVHIDPTDRLCLYSGPK